MELEAARPDPERQVVIDEVQKVPALLNEVHWLMENRSFHFALCGSSARKVRRDAANLLGGRALRYELRGLSAAEIGSGLELDRLLNRGYLPRIHQAARYRQLLDAYVADYLREEVAAEGMVRNLPAFSRFLDVAALSDTEPVNFSNIARECGVSSPTGATTSKGCGAWRWSTIPTGAWSSASSRALGGRRTGSTCCPRRRSCGGCGRGNWWRGGDGGSELRLIQDPERIADAQRGTGGGDSGCSRTVGSDCGRNAKRGGRNARPPVSQGAGCREVTA